MFHEAGAHLGDVGGSHHAILIGVGHRAGVHVEGKILQRVIVGKTAALPSRGRSSLHHEQRGPGTVRASTFDQRPENFFLRGPGLNSGDGLQQLFGGFSARLAGAGRGHRFEHPLHDFRLQPGNLARENLRDGLLHCLLDFVIFRHRQNSVSRFARAGSKLAWVTSRLSTRTLN